ASVFRVRQVQAQPARHASDDTSGLCAAPSLSATGGEEWGSGVDHRDISFDFSRRRHSEMVSPSSLGGVVASRISWMLTQSSQIKTGRSGACFISRQIEHRDPDLLAFSLLFLNRLPKVLSAALASFS